MCSDYVNTTCEWVSLYSEKISFSNLSSVHSFSINSTFASLINKNKKHHHLLLLISISSSSLHIRCDVRIVIVLFAGWMLQYFSRFHQQLVKTKPRGFEYRFKLVVVGKCKEHASHLTSSYVVEFYFHFSRIINAL